MTHEVSDESVIVRRKIANRILKGDQSSVLEVVLGNHTIFLRTCIDYTRRLMSELCELDSILLAEESFLMLPILYAVDLNRLVRLRGHEKLSRVIKVQREYRRRLISIFPSEELELGLVNRSCEAEVICYCTFVGRKVLMTSLTFAVLEIPLALPIPARPFTALVVGFGGLGESKSIGVEDIVVGCGREIWMSPVCDRWRKLV
jgi:hypothetical protein